MHLHDLCAHLDDIGFGEGFGGSALGGWWHVRDIEGGLGRRRRGHEMDEVVEGEWGVILTHACRSAIAEG